MKAPYFIDFARNVIVVTRKFRNAASQMDTDEYKTMMKLKEHGMPIEVQAAPERKKRAATLSYAKMLKHISCLTDAETYRAEFEAVREASLGEVNPYRYVLNWYEKKFPNHAAVPELDENLKVINTPDNYAA